MCIEEKFDVVKDQGIAETYHWPLKCISPSSIAATEALTFSRGRDFPEQGPYFPAPIAASSGHLNKCYL